MLVEHPGRLASVVLISPPTRTREHLASETWRMRFVDSITGSGDLEHYTWWWLLSSVTQEFADRHFDALQDIVRRRLEADKGRFHPSRVRRWMELQLSDFFHPSELQDNATPVLIVAPAFDGWAPIHTLRRLQSRIPNASLAAVPRAATSFSGRIRNCSSAPAGASCGRRPRVGCCLGIRTGSRRSRAATPGGQRDPAVVFLHGYLMSPAIWGPCVHRLEQAGLPCLAPWQRGHGDRVAPAAGWTLRDEARELLGELERRGVRRCVVVGHSMGGMIAIELASLLGARLSGLALGGDDGRTLRALQATELQSASAFLP
jgi:pimeloyl-ACP methyl ester carboxylesterase